MRASTSPNEFDDLRLADEALADFRCEKCEGRYPFEMMVIQDGHKVCTVNCAYDMAPTERVALAAEAVDEAAQLTAETRANNARRIGEGNLYSLMDGVSVCTGISSGSTTYNVHSPTEIELTAGGSTKPFVLSGIGFTSADELSASHTGITFGAATISTDLTSWTTTVAASGLVPRGEYDFHFNGSVFRKVFRVL